VSLFEFVLLASLLFVALKLANLNHSGQLSLGIHKLRASYCLSFGLFPQVTFSKGISLFFMLLYPVEDKAFGAALR
jgi:hypothetical protein